MNDRKREREARGAASFVKRATEFVDSSAFSRMCRQVEEYFSALDAACMRKNGGTDLFALWGRRIGRGLTGISFTVMGLWLLHQLGIL